MSIFPPLPDKKFDIIYADPPWTYKCKGIPLGGVEKHYETLSNRYIWDLPVESIANNDALLFLWCVFPKLPACLATMTHWGFEYKTLGFTWIKTTLASEVAQGRFFFPGDAVEDSMDDKFGIGHYTKSNAEVCLIGTRGSTKVIHDWTQDRTVRSTILCPRGEHSVKPDEARKRIVQLYGDRPRIELFARQRVDGWMAWGDEV